MTMTTLNAISSHLSFTASSATAGVVSLLSKASYQHPPLNTLALIRYHEGRPASVAVRRGRKRSNSSSVVVRAAGAAEATTSGAAATTEISSAGELKRRGDSYFLTDIRPVILFDGVCNMCNGGVNFMLDNDNEGKVRFAALQSEAGRALLVKSGRAPDDISSIVLVDKDRSYIRSEAILRIGQCLTFPYPPAAFLGFIVPMFLRDALYDTVANNRYSVFGKTDACRLSDLRFAERFIE